MLSPKQQVDEMFKTENGNGNVKKEEKEDSPAFCLRPRRSTPKPSPSPASGNRYSLLKNSSALGFNLKLNSPAMVAVKRKLFRLPLKADESFTQCAKAILPPSPSRSIAENVNIGIFAEKISAENLSLCADYPLNYISLRIVHVVLAATEEKSDDAAVTNSSTVVTPALVLLTEEATNRDKEDNVLGHGKPLLCVDLHDAYALCPGLAVGKVLEITKFRTESNASDISFRISDECDMVTTMPYKVVVKPCSDPFWIPFMSLNDKFEDPVNKKMLNVATMVPRSKEPPPPLRLTSFCTMKSTSESKISPSESKNHLSNNNQKEADGSLEQQLSKPSATNPVDAGSLMQTRKRLCRSTSDMVANPQKRDKQRRACSSSLV